jgi:inosose dehydratase
VGAAGLASARHYSFAAHAAQSRITLGFSLYGMKSLPLGAALRTCAELGYDDVELPLMADFAGDVDRLTPERRREIRSLLAATGLNLPALMDNLPIASAERRAANLERLKRIAEAAHDLVPDSPPLFETVLGGKPNEWPQLREAFVERLREWAEVAEKHRLTIAVKPHAMNALHTPDDALWLIGQVASPHLRLAYDYSHYELQGLELEPTLRKLAPQTVFVHVKDAARADGKAKFLLPGEGTIDYAQYFRLLGEVGYRGSVTVEVSAAIHTQPGYDPRAAAAKCYHHLKKAWQEAGLPPR